MTWEKKGHLNQHLFLPACCQMSPRISELIKKLRIRDGCGWYLLIENKNDAQCIISEIEKHKGIEKVTGVAKKCNA